MNAKLFFSLNLVAYMGIGACNGTNMNGMDKKKPIKKEIKEELSTSSGTNVSSAEQDNKKIRKDTVEQISKMVEKELSFRFHEEYRNFLIEYDSSKLESLGLGDPFRIFSFETPESEAMIPLVAKREVNRYMDMYCAFPRDRGAIEQVNIPLCIAAHSEAHSYKDGDEDEAMIYYYIDLNPTEHEDRPLKIYRVLRNNTVESIRTDNMVDFIEYCKRESKGIKESEEDMQKKKRRKK
ncbi:SMI1/KNR4 family protein [Candidatus Cardinium sp. TP]|uniref:SMI1/KNR4 family protein n=1 Tax=Candidatus Cardinium sp. TP TaxID=2961955 RepID=UPI0021B02571|nr:SMI1/KNR4 family protein [Candidatus Cardinium sp. TP]MCT4697364.1 SMI1/KNR4 family protein [Candidatus Cardinium sp. TP]